MISPSSFTATRKPHCLFLIKTKTIVTEKKRKEIAPFKITKKTKQNFNKTIETYWGKQNLKFNLRTVLRKKI